VEVVPGPGTVEIDGIIWEVGVDSGGLPILKNLGSGSAALSIQTDFDESLELGVAGMVESDCLVGPNILDVGGFDWEITTDALGSPVFCKMNSPSGVSYEKKSRMVGGSLLSPIVPGLSVEKILMAGTSFDKRDRKEFCTRCGCLVKISGHEYRCRQPHLFPVSFKKKAWVGDARWECFVRWWLVETGGEVVDASKYVTNEALASAYPVLAPVIDLGQHFGDNVAMHTHASCVEVMVAMSAIARHLLVRHFAMGDKLRNTLWYPTLVYRVDQDTTIPVQPSFDGFCYLWLFEERHWMHATEEFGAFPEWGDLRAAAKKGTVLFKPGVVIWIQVFEGVCHLSDVQVADMTLYCGSAIDLPLEAGVRVGGMRTANLTEAMKYSCLGAGWSFQVTIAYEDLRRLVGQLAQKWVVYADDEVYKTVCAGEKEYNSKLSLTAVLDAVRTLASAVRSVQSGIEPNVNYVDVGGAVVLYSHETAAEVQAGGQGVIHRVDNGERPIVQNMF